MKKILLLTGTLLFTTTQHCMDIAESVAEPYSSIHILPQDLYGLFSNQQIINNLIDIIHPKVIIDIAPGFGTSTVFMAERLPEDGKLYAIDTWNNYTYTAGHDKVKAGLVSSYHQFLSNMLYHNLTNKVIAIKEEPFAAAQMLTIRGDIIHIEGHFSEEELFNVIMAWYPRVNKSGVLCGDHYDEPSVRNSVARAANMLSIDLRTVGNCWIFISKNN